VDDTQKAVRAATQASERPQQTESKPAAARPSPAKPAAKAEANDDFFSPAPRPGAPAPKTTVGPGNGKAEGFADFDF
jgi:hypothetical protein